MVTAIVIPIICFYFYYISYKESKAFNAKWKNLGHVKEEAILSGKILSIKEEKQRYYYHRYIHILEITVQTSYHVITAKKITPLKKAFEGSNLDRGEFVYIYGSWEKEEFQISRISKNSD